PRRQHNHGLSVGDLRRIDLPSVLGKCRMLDSRLGFQYGQADVAVQRCAVGNVEICRQGNAKSACRWVHARISGQVYEIALRTASECTATSARCQRPPIACPPGCASNEFSNKMLRFGWLLP